MRRIPALVCSAAAGVLLALAGCATGLSSTGRRTASSSATTTTTTQPVAHMAPKPPPPAYPHLLAPALSTHSTSFVPAVTWKGRPAAWIARSPSGIAMLSFQQPEVQLRLHSGTIDAGTRGWRYGPIIAGLEREHLVAAFNGGFRLNVGAGGFESYGRAAAPLGYGLGSIITYTDGTTDIGSWHQEVPAPGRTVGSVRQNLSLLIDHGTAAPTLDCLSCWGATLGGAIDPARSALGIQANGHLVWVGAEHATVTALADALLSAGVVRAVELDINPEWVAGYLYGHGGGSRPPAPVPVIPGQQGIPGQYLAPWSRDFFTITTS
jgi:hypothetical protein